MALTYTEAQIQAKLDSISSIADDVETNANDIDTLETTVDGLSTTVGEHTTTLGTLSTKVDETFLSVSNGKSLVASAITDKGVTTASDATFQTMANNIASISLGKECYYYKCTGSASSVQLSKTKHYKILCWLFYSNRTYVSNYVYDLNNNSLTAETSYCYNTSYQSYGMCSHNGDTGVLTVGSGYNSANYCYTFIVEV